MLTLVCALQLTSQLGEQAKYVNPPGRSLKSASQVEDKAAGSLSTTADELNPVKQSRTTADLLDWADDIANISGSLQGSGSSSNDDLNTIHFDDHASIKVQAAVAQSMPKQEMTSREAAAKALMKAAKHGGSTRLSKDTPSRYLDSKFYTVHPCVAYPFCANVG